MTPEELKKIVDDYNSVDTLAQSGLTVAGTRLVMVMKMIIVLRNKNCSILRVAIFRVSSFCWLRKCKEDFVQYANKCEIS